MQNKPFCRNMNHGKSNPGVAFCPNCGERFKNGQAHSCTEAKHNERRKSGSLYCYDCGKSLKTK